MKTYTIADLEGFFLALSREAETHSKTFVNGSPASHFAHGRSNAFMEAACYCRAISTGDSDLDRLKEDLDKSENAGIV